MVLKCQNIIIKMVNLKDLNTIGMKMVINRTDAKGAARNQRLAVWPPLRSWGVGRRRWLDNDIVEVSDAGTCRIELEPFNSRPQTKGLREWCWMKTIDRWPEAVINGGGVNQPNTKTLSDSEGHFSLG